MKPKVSGLFRHPVKGFTPEPVDQTELTAGEVFPCDRLYAVENGPSGFDPNAPKHISKMKFVVLARDSVLSTFQTRFDEETSTFQMTTSDGIVRNFGLETVEGVADFEAFMSKTLEGRFSGPLKLVKGLGAHRFTDHHSGAVSLLNLASAQAFSEALGQTVEPSRFRMNVHLEGLSAWDEDTWSPGSRIAIGEAELEVLKPTVRCKATHANPETGEYDIDLVPQLMSLCSRNTMGIYATIVKSGRIARGDELVVKA